LILISIFIIFEAIQRMCVHFFNLFHNSHLSVAWNHQR
jgi:hypothetical protein